MTDAKPKTMVPTVHMNGNTWDDLIRSHLEAMSALEKAILVLQTETAPHGRNFYPQGQDALKQATIQHGQRLAKLVDVRSELNAIAEAIYDRKIRIAGEEG